MGASYGLGIVFNTLDTSASREDAVAVLRSVASFAGTNVRDLINDDLVVDVSPDGTVTTLAGDEAASIRAAITDGGGTASNAAFEYLDGYHILIDADFEEGAPEDVPEDAELFVGPLAGLREKLDRLLEREDIGDPAQHLHRGLRKLCDEASRLRIPLTLGS